MSELLEFTILKNIGRQEDLVPLLVFFGVASCLIGLLAWALGRRGVSWAVVSLGISLFVTPVVPLVLLLILELFLGAEEKREGTTSAQQAKRPQRPETTISPLRDPDFQNVSDHLSSVSSNRDILPQALKAFSDWFRSREVEFLGLDDDRVHIAPQLFYFKREKRLLLGRKWSISDFPLDSAAKLAQEAHAFGEAASKDEHPEVFLLVFEDRGASGARRLAFQEVRRSGENDLRFCNLVERDDGFVRIGGSYSQDHSQANVALDIAKSFWFGAGVDIGVETPDEITVGKNTEEEIPQTEDSEEELNVTFEVTTSYEGSSETQEELLAQSRSAWIPPGTSESVAGRKILGGMVYVGEELSPVDGYQTKDPALIDPKLEIFDGPTDPSGTDLSYWPSFADLRPVPRGTYLDWLASGRRDEGYDIGYVFLFFYGDRKSVV